jgi:CRP-like cAMP-binding protein/CheY-like chemotaxis protein/Skp family chaperone for outer membrane proteins
VARVSFTLPTANKEAELHGLEKVVVFLGEPHDATRKEVKKILNHAGLKQVSAHVSLANLTKLTGQVPPDLLIVADDLDPGVFDFIRDIRHNKIGANPFMLITTLVAPDHVDAVKHAMRAGTDDIIVKPVKEEQLLQRLKRVTLDRAAFVVTSDYLGPDRRAKSRPSAIRRLKVLNTFLEKASGNDIDMAAIRQAVEESIPDVLEARLDSNGYRLGFVCNLVLEAYAKKNITPDLRQKLTDLVAILRDGAKTAERLKEHELALLCGSLVKEVEALCDRYETPTEKDISLIQKLSLAVVQAMKPKTPTEQIQEETKQAVENYQQRERDNFESAHDIQRAPGEAQPIPVDEQVLEIMPLDKGQYLFKQGDPALSAYILNSGSIAIFKEIDGRRVPVARVSKGEFFGEMAIIDGRPRRNSAMALEKSTLSLVSKTMIEEKMAASDPLVQTVVRMLSNSLQTVHDAYAPKGRSILDSAREMREQAQHVASYVTQPSGPMVREAAGPLAAQMSALTEEIAKLVASVADLDQRTPAVPTEKDLAG